MNTSLTLWDISRSDYLIRSMQTLFVTTLVRERSETTPWFLEDDDKEINEMDEEEYADEDEAEQEEDDE